MRLRWFYLLMLLLCAGLPPRPAQAQTAGIEFGLRYENERYIITMRPTVTPAAPNQSLSAQVTLRVPHGVGSERFVVRSLQPLVKGTNWAALSRVDAPSENRSADYISFEVSYTLGDRGVFNWSAGRAVDVFSFTNSGPCLGTVALLSANDPFGELPNSAGTNPGNYIAVRGLNGNNGNDYVGNLGTGQAECSLRSDVRLAGYTVQALESGVLITWQTVTESDVVGFQLLAQQPDSKPSSLQAELITAQRSGQSMGASYRYAIPATKAASYDPATQYWLHILLADDTLVEVLLGPAWRPQLYLPLLQSKSIPSTTRYL